MPGPVSLVEEETGILDHASKLYWLNLRTLGSKERNSAMKYKVESDPGRHKFTHTLTSIHILFVEMHQVNCVEKFPQHCDNVKRKGPTFMEISNNGKLEEFKYHVWVAKRRNKHSLLPSPSSKGRHNICCPSTNVRGLRCRHFPLFCSSLYAGTENSDLHWTVRIQCHTPLQQPPGRWGLDIFVFSYLTPLLSPQTQKYLLHVKCHLVSVCLGFRWPEGKREGRRRDRMSIRKCPVKVRAGLGLPSVVPSCCLHTAC